ncbi:MAG: chitobiase/beta-hexosaminidase C-terminal domain-containing protein [Lachnospiraceae bacterium]|nr:chitobiase/beta-hexosaminidase C-terminal domain-containing protein [Lachnospiraceae bacterium]
MKCPNCGNEIKNGELYCEKCGAELQIVPDMEIDIESEMKKTMSHIAKDDIAKDYDIDFDEDPNIISMILGTHKSGKFFYVFLGIIVVLIVVAAVLLGRRISSQNSYDYQMSKAVEFSDSGNYLSAISSLESAYKIKPSADILFTIADYYYTLERDNDAIYTLQEVIGSDFTQVEKESAYKKIISLYLSSQSYDLLADALKGCEIESIVKNYGEYMVFEPEFNLKEGTYNETVTLKLSTDGPGKIYYTTDKSVPNTGSNLFDGPIFLEYGSYVINAVYVSPHGVVSDVVTKKYLIDVEFEFEPDILTESGEYTTATLIEADVPPMYTLYYTIDGGDPDKNSKQYKTPIPMEAGEHTYKFVCYAADGTMSSVVERKYTLNYNPAYTPAQAVQRLSEYLIQTGYFIDGERKEGVSGRFLLMYSVIYPIEGMGNYYFVVEYHESEAGIRTNTNNIYAVGCDDLSLYKVKSSGNGDYTLVGF